MQQPDKRALALMSGSSCNILTYAEEKELDRWILESESNMILFEEWLEKEIQDPSLSFINKEDVDRLIKKPIITMQMLRAAIFFGVIAGMAIWSYYTNERTFDGSVAGDKSVNRHAGSKRILNTVSGEVSMVYLADSSSIELAQNSSLIYHKPYRTYRFVELKGEAIFYIKPNNDLPQFHVYLNDELKLNSRGGRFQVRFDKKTGSVYLKAIEGQLRFIHEKDTWILETGESATYLNNTWKRSTN